MQVTKKTLKIQSQLSPKANEVIRLTLANMEKSPCSFNMRYWALREDKGTHCMRTISTYSIGTEFPAKVEDFESCGATLCFAGWLIYTNARLQKVNSSLYTEVSYDVDSSYDYAKIALLSLGIKFEGISTEDYYKLSRKIRKNSTDVRMRLLASFKNFEIKDVGQLEEILVKYKIYDRDLVYPS
jgi:hypothetical protein